MPRSAATDQLSVDHGRAMAMIVVNDVAFQHISEPTLPAPTVEALFTTWHRRYPDDGVIGMAFRNTLSRVLWLGVRSLTPRQLADLTEGTEVAVRAVLDETARLADTAQLPDLINAMDGSGGDGERPDNATLLVAAVTVMHARLRLYVPSPRDSTVADYWSELARIWAVSGALSAPTP